MRPNKSIGWINGNWGLPHDLKISINDRGLNFSDGIFETIYVENGHLVLLTEHFNRLTKNAKLLGMETPPQLESLQKILHEGIEKCCLKNNSGSIRLNWSRGENTSRGIDLHQSKRKELTSQLWIEINQIKPNFNPVSTMISQYEKRNASSVLSQCKTLNYIQSIQARREAQEAGFHDALLVSTTDEICCGTTSNIIVKRRNQFLTPRLESGCLAGVMRAQALKKGIIQEAKLSIDPEEDDEWLLINSLSCRAISRINKIPTKLFTDPESFWRSLFTKND
ncbi:MULTISPECIES: aminotransferase class IV [Prochlorococcus]|uniref:aminotransferase class IV n=1 Tax=Prochlorococcus TaxID=1218 RepID=UPI0005338A59|nr:MULTISPECIES: aminotransferase class IV [Prochlorococcus]KGG13728.1 Aminodeoxychorismate lyase [Prochlorococcus sp. MIT 0601]